MKRFLSACLLLAPTCVVYSLPLTVVVVENKGFVERVLLPTGEVLYTGMAIDVFEAALDHICATSPVCYSKQEVTYFQSPDNVYGGNTSSGVWTGVIGELQAGRADVGVGDINELLSRSRVVDFTGSWLDAPLAFLASPVTPAITSNLFGWLRPFTNGVWLSLLAMTALFAVSLARVERWSPFSYRNLPPVRGTEELRQRINMKDSWHRAVNSLLGQGPWGIDLSSHSSRLLWWAMAFLSLFTTTFYTSSLTAQLTAALPYTPINSLADIQADRIPFCVTSNSSAQNFIENPVNAASIRRMASYMVTAPSLEACLNKLLDDADPVRVVMAEAPVLAFLSSSPPYCGPVVVGTLTAQGYYSFPVRRGHPVAGLLTEALLANMESLTTGDIVARYSTTGGCGGGGGGGDGGGAAPSIGVEDFGGVFLATLILVLLSWALLACEVAVWRRREGASRAQRCLFKFCGGHYYVEAYKKEDAEAEAHYVEEPFPRGARKQQATGAAAAEAAAMPAAPAFISNPLNWDS